MKISDAPGLKIRRRVGGDVYYWVAPAADVIRGYRPKSRPLPKDLSPNERAAVCRVQHADLVAWREGTGQLAERYSFRWLINRYKTDPHSPYHGVKGKTRDGYDQMLKIIDTAIGADRFDPILERGAYRARIYGHHVREWHADCANPNPKIKDSKPRPARARYMIVVLRLLSSYGVEIGAPGAAELRELLSVIRFKVRPARTSAPTRDQVIAIANQATDMGFPSIAITTLAQFLFTERRISIIGEWEDGQWRPGWVWQNIDHWVISYNQNKTGVVERVYDLRDTPALLDLLKAVPEERRIGPVIICETTGQPWRYRHYISTFRKIARAADVPDDVWSMDMRAGGATEVGAIQGITRDDLKAAGGWKSDAMAARYDRGSKVRAQKVVRLRSPMVGTDRNG
jgi:hypothetical protein